MQDQHFSTNPIVREAQNLVRETAYNLGRIKDAGTGEDLSRALMIYKGAVTLLYLLDPQGAEFFVSKTYQPLDNPFRPNPAFAVGARVKALRGDWQEGTIVAAEEDFSRFQVQWDTVSNSPRRSHLEGKKTWYKREFLSLV